MHAIQRASWRSSLKAGPARRGGRAALWPRPFSQHCPLLLSRIPTRTQLPYLHASVRQGGPPFQIRFFRLFTIREPKTLREAGVAFLQWGVVFYTMYGLYKIAEWGLAQDALERRQPTPHDYAFWTRVRLREALGEEDAGTRGAALANWKTTGLKFLEVIARLEDRTGDGRAVRSPLGDQEDIFVDGVGRTGLDVAACSEPWRRGYYQALMGAGRCAERLDGWVRDRTRGILFPAQYMVGPSNPAAKPVPHGGATAPREEDCEPAFEAPQKYYLKIITTRGFSVGQRLRAALAYADWLRYKELNEAAEGMQTWAVDIALEGIDAEPASVVDNRTGVLKAGVSTLTPNLLLAVETFGTHFALTGNMAAALPIFLAILRTQQNLPPPAPPAAKARNDKPINPYWEAIWSVVLPPPYPAPPPSGNNLLTQTPDEVCASTRTMTHIGEVLFASDLAALAISPSAATAPSLPARAAHPTATQSAGLAWTRQAADIAEATLRALDPDAGPDRKLSRAGPAAAATPAQRAEHQRARAQQKHCAQCLNLALDNWLQMVERFERAEQERGRPPVGRGDRSSSSMPPARTPMSQAPDVRSMMEAAYAKDAQPDAVLATATRAMRGEASAAAAQAPSPLAAPDAAGRSSGGGWGMFWSSKLGLTSDAAPATTPGALADGVGNEMGAAPGPWQAEAVRVRARRWEARLLGRQLGIDE